MLELERVLVLWLFSICFAYAQNETANDSLNDEVDDKFPYDSVTSRYAPELTPVQEPGYGRIPYTITEARLREIRSHFMYWYFDLGGSNGKGDRQTEIHEGSSRLHKRLNFHLPFFGFRYNYTNVDLNGFLLFSDYIPNHSPYPLLFPEKNWPQKHDPSFIGVFLSKCKIGRMRYDDLDKRKEGVYYRLESNLRLRTDQFGVELRERVKWDIREGIIGADTFDPRHVIITTWKNVSFEGGIQEALYKTNTFQIILATDEVFTYAIFNYLNIQWTAHTEAGGSTAFGDGGISAYVGFNAGNGTRSYEYHPYSQSSQILDLTKTGWGNGFPGRHIFRIDEDIKSGSCIKESDSVNNKLVFAPESGNMLGGTIVNITGPCFEPTDIVTCKFDIADEVHGTVVDRNKAICIQPQLSIEGYVRLVVTVGHRGKKWQGKYFVESPSTAEKIYFNNRQVHEVHPSEIEINWLYTNLTSNRNANVRISLWGYHKTTSKSALIYIDELATDVYNSGLFTIIPATYRNRNNHILDLQFGFIQINLTDPNNGKITPTIWSRPIPLGWYFAPQWEREIGKNWAEVLCNNWIKEDRTLKNFTQELTECPCTLEHALLDKGRFLPNPDCDKDYNPSCMLHNGAIHCVRTSPLTSTSAEQQCCYDRNGFLMLSHDSKWGSYPRRSHSSGQHMNNIPSLSQWHQDIIPRYICCAWQYGESDGCKALRLKRRPSQDCVAYQAPAIAGIFGDPHIITFDDNQYSFNGKGEFVLVRSFKKDNPLDIQARFEQLSSNKYKEDVKATHLTSVVGRGNFSAVVEVRLRPQQAQWRYRLDVFVDARPVYFDRSPLKFQHFRGVTVYTPTYILNQSEVVVMFDSGAGLEVVENKGFMTARVYLPQLFINHTRGLFGNWSLNKYDDFTNPDGTKLLMFDNYYRSETIHNDFGLRWMVHDRENSKIGGSLFLRQYGKTSDYYNDKNFKPQFNVSEESIPLNRSIEIHRAYEICGSDRECFYDYALTYNKDLALFTLLYKYDILMLKEMSRHKIISCGVLETPKFGRKSTFQFTPGTGVRFECDEGYHLVGDIKRVCTVEGHWSDFVDGPTRCLSNSTNHTEAVQTDQEVQNSTEEGFSILELKLNLALNLNVKLRRKPKHGI